MIGQIRKSKQRFIPEQECNNEKRVIIIAVVFSTIVILWLLTTQIGEKEPFNDLIYEDIIGVTVEVLPPRTVYN